MPIPNKKEAILVLSAKEKIYKELSSWIVKGTMKPEEKINEAESAAYFSVSRTPVREALQQLAEQKLVYIIPSRGSFVTPLTKESGDEIYEALAAISADIACLACRKRTDKQLDELRDKAQAFEQAYENQQYSVLPEYDNAFHSYLSEIAGNEYLSSYSSSLQMHTHRFEYLLITNKQNRSASIAEHTAIIDAISRQDETLARQLASDNWLRTYQENIRILL